MYTQFIAQTFGLEKHPKVAKITAIVLPVIMVMGVIALILQGWV
jgi:hypothetical protein